MHRRQFLKSAVGMGLGVVSGQALAAVTSPHIEERFGAASFYPPDKRKFWVWQGRSDKASEAELRAKYQKFKSRGIHGVFLEGGLNEREFNLIREAGLELHSWMWTTNRGDKWIREHHPDWYMVSRSGKSCFDNPPYVEYYRWVSPVIPGVQNFLEDQVDELAAHPAVQGVHLDYVRYPDVILPRGLWAKYHLDQTEELPDYDFCYSSHTRKAFQEFCGRDPLEIKDPAHDQQWLRFRYDSVVQLVHKLSKTAHGHGKKISAAVFPTPHIARKVCRQSWDRFELDFACPMTYQAFYNETVDWIGDCVLENIQSVVFPVYAGLYMPDLNHVGDFKRAIHVALHNGAAGVSLFGGIDDAHWDAFEIAANSE